MKSEIPIARDIVLIGGGHAHLSVLMAFAMKPLPGVRLTMISRESYAAYSGMLPGLLSGHYQFDDIHIDLRPLCQLASARYYHGSVTGLGLDNRMVYCQDRPPIPYDLLSIDVGSVPRADHIIGAREFCVPIKPVDMFLKNWPGVEKRLRALARPARISVIGGGAGGVEGALCLRHRLLNKAEGGLPFAPEIKVFSANAVPLAEHGRAAQDAMMAALQRDGVEFFPGSAVAEVTAEEIITVVGESFASDLTLLLTNGASQPWLEASGLACDDAGFVEVDKNLRSLSHHEIFAAGDIAHFTPQPLAKSGVYAVRQGPVLARNLRRAVLGKSLRPYRPQKRTLALITTGGKHAVASYGARAVAGRWVWRWKDWIDRRWMKKYQQLPEMPEPKLPKGVPFADLDHLMRCGGCGAKVAADVLQQGLKTLPAPVHEDILLGVGDDAAVMRLGNGRVLAQTVDFFRPFIDDPYLFAQIAVNHCLNDLYAMGIAPHSALAQITLPYGPKDKVADDLNLLLAGASKVLSAAKVDLVGGHTGEGLEMSFGLTVNGYGAEDDIVAKSGAVAGDCLILTKALGTGVIFAAQMRARAGGDVVESALAGMLTSNAEGSVILRQYGARAMTDVTGFGLLGHLGEMLDASKLDAELDLVALPLLPGALDLARQGFRSSLQQANEAAAERLERPHTDNPRYAMLFDPQTAGGLLAAVPAAEAGACLAALKEAGYEAASLGRLCAGAGRVKLH